MRIVHILLVVNIGHVEKQHRNEVGYIEKRKNKFLGVYDTSVM